MHRSTRRGHAKLTYRVRSEPMGPARGASGRPAIRQRTQKRDHIPHFVLTQRRYITHLLAERGFVLDVLQVLRWQVIELMGRSVCRARIPVLRLRVPGRVEAYGVLECPDCAVVKEHMPFRYVP